MTYRNLRQCVAELEATGQLVRIEDPIDPHLEAAEIHRRIFQAGGPAFLLTQVRGCRFPVVGNLLGTIERARFIFRHTLDTVRRLVELKLDPGEFWKQPRRYLRAAASAYRMLPRRVSRGAVLANEVSLRDLPHLVCWPDDGGAFITLPQVYSETADQPGLARSNLGMYRVQLSGGEYDAGNEIGLHYQIHRSIGVHHAAALRRGQPFRVNIFVGGPPAMNLAAVMPLPEGISELAFAGVLAAHRIPMACLPGQLPVSAEADFCITGTVHPSRQLPEGPFGDHLGYYARVHDFPVLMVDRVFHRNNAIWPFTVVGRPPQEDTIYGQLIHELTGPAIPAVLPGVREVHAVDAAGVHPLLLALGSERYTPYAHAGRPQELLTQANAILGQGQLSLAKYLWIAAAEDIGLTDLHDIQAFFQAVLERVDWTRDLHFQTETTIDTLDYSGTALNQGSKVVIAAAGPARRKLATEVPDGLRLPDGFRDPCVCLPGVLAITGPAVDSPAAVASETAYAFCQAFHKDNPINSFPLIVLVDDSHFTAQSLNNFLWITFTRSNPASDLHGIEARVVDKHWGCQGAVVIDARSKPHHAPPLVEDPQVTRRVDALAARGGPLHGIL